MERSSNLLDEALGLNHHQHQHQHQYQHLGVSTIPGRVVLIEDRVETSGAFVLHHFIKRALSFDNLGVVIFVSLAYHFSHYERILKKLGCNLGSQKESGRFLFFDMLKLECPENCNEGGLVELYRKIHKAVEVSTAPERDRIYITIIIDDLSLLEVSAHGSSNHVLDFLHYCHTLTSEKGCSLVMLNHDDIYSSMTGQTLNLQMEYLADVVVKAEPLATGLASDVHGQLTILNKWVVDVHGSLRNKLQNFHFKVKENTVDYFYPGSPS